MRLCRRRPSTRDNALVLLYSIHERLDEYMADTTALAAALTALGGQVDAAVAALSTESVPTQTDVDALTAQVQDDTAKLAAALPAVPVDPAAPVAEPDPNAAPAA